MFKNIIDIGLTALNVVQLLNNNARDEKKTDERKKQQRVNKQISNLRNAAYILRRIGK